MTTVGMIGMGMRDDGTRHRFPGIDVEITLRTIKSSFREADQHDAQTSPLRGSFGPFLRK
ncbi:MAG: hypothetical protein RLZZ370_821 [Bacteroidota bacterium]